MPKLLSTLNVGDKIKFGKHQVNAETPWSIIWKVADKNHSGYPANSVTLVTEKIIDSRAFDAAEPGNSAVGRSSNGNNRYSLSNLRQWLNKSGSGWYVAQHSLDVAPSYSNRPGFLSNFTTKEIAALLDTTLIVAKNVADGGGSETVVDKIFLFSKTELGLDNENGIAEGSKMALYSDDASRIVNCAQQFFNNTLSTKQYSSADVAWRYIVRTPRGDNDSASLVIYVHDSGAEGAQWVANGDYVAIRPSMNLSSGVLVSDSVDSDGCYTVVWNTAPVITGSDANLGNKNLPFSYTYQVGDAEGDAVTVTEQLDGQVIRTVSNAVKNSDLTLTISADKWAALGINAQHTLTITVTDSNGATATRTLLFTRVNAAPTITGTEPGG